MKSRLIISLLTIAVSVSIGWEAKTYHDSQIAPASDHPDYPDYKVAIEKLRTLNDVDLEEYSRLKESEAKYKKAEEILDKVMLIFLADLGLKSHGVVKVSAPEVMPSSIPTKIGLINRAQPSSSPTPPLSPQMIEKHLSEVSSESEAKDFLANTAAPNLYSEIPSLVPLNSNQLKFVEGTYTGQIVFDDPSKPTWTVQWDLHGAIANDGKFTGYELVVLSKDGTPFSTTKGSDGLQDYTSLPQDPLAVYVQAYGGKGYMQLYSMEKLGRIMGNYYEKNGGEYRRTGVISMSKN